MPRLGLNFRATAGFVADGDGETYVLPTDAYPTTRGGLTFGYRDGWTPAAVDRSAAYGPRLAGAHLHTNDEPHYFRLDVPAGLGTPLLIHMAMGDLAAASPDGARVRALREEFTAGFFNAAHGDELPAAVFVDATLVERSAATWLAGEAGYSTEDPGAFILFQLGVGSHYTGTTPLAHVALEHVEPGTTLPAYPVRSAAALPVSAPSSSTSVEAVPIRPQGRTILAAAAAALEIGAVPARRLPRLLGVAASSLLRLATAPFRTALALLLATPRRPIPPVSASLFLAEAQPAILLVEAAATLTIEGDTMQRGNTVRATVTFRALNTGSVLDPDVATFRLFDGEENPLTEPLLMGGENRVSEGVYFHDFEVPDLPEFVVEMSGIIEGMPHLTRRLVRPVFAV